MSMWRRLRTRRVRDTSDIKVFFEELTQNNYDRHGDPEKLLRYHIGIIKRYGQLKDSDLLLDLGCGGGEHLLALAEVIRRGIGIDFSESMIRLAEALRKKSLWRKKLRFRVDKAEHLATLPDESINVAICVGSLEHMLDKRAVFRSVFRKLRSGGRFVCLTVNRGYIWHSCIGPLLGLDTRHLSTDKFITKREAVRLSSDACFAKTSVSYWSFVPLGDMHFVIGFLMQMLDRIGRRLKIDFLRGGLLILAKKELGS